MAAATKFSGWTKPLFERRLAEVGCVMDADTYDAELRRAVRKALREGSLVKYRAHWNTGSPRFGIVSPLKIFYTTPAIYDAPENAWFFGREQAA